MALLMLSCLPTDRIGIFVLSIVFALFYGYNTYFLFSIGVLLSSSGADLMAVNYYYAGVSNFFAIAATLCGLTFGKCELAPRKKLRILWAGLRVNNTNYGLFLLVYNLYRHIAGFPSSSMWAEVRASTRAWCAPAAPACFLRCTRTDIADGGWNYSADNGRPAYEAHSWALHPLPGLTW